MAMAIGSRRGPDLTVADFVGLGGRLGLRERAVRTTLDDLAQSTEAWLDDLETGLPFDAGQIRKLKRVILRRRDHLARPITT